jgi:hypothetical protein
MLTAQAHQVASPSDSHCISNHQAATLVTVTKPPSNMAGIPTCLSIFIKPNLDHSVFSDKFIVKPIFSSTKWFIDTGAIDHMVITNQFYTSMHHVDNINVNLPNGQSVLVTHIGSIQVTPTLLLIDALCVPSFDFNLIYVSKLTSSLNCCIFFLSTCCFIEDLMQWKMIGMGKQQNGLYLLDSSPNSTHVVATNVPKSSLHRYLYSLSFVKHSNSNFHVWHCRLGHPSLSRMSFLSSIVPNVSYSCTDAHTCTVCPLAKQKRLPFPKNNHLSSTSFELLHVDI